MFENSQCILPIVFMNTGVSVDITVKSRSVCVIEVPVLQELYIVRLSFSNTFPLGANT